MGKLRARFLVVAFLSGTSIIHASDRMTTKTQQRPLSLRIYFVHAKPLSVMRDRNMRELTDLFGKTSCQLERVVTCIRNDPDDVIRQGNANALVDFNPIPADVETANVFNVHLKQLHINQLSNGLKHADAISRIASFADGAMMMMPPFCIWSWKMMRLRTPLEERKNDRR
jgi:hypothetical protein